MPILLFLSYVILEFYVFTKVWSQYGFVNVLFALILAGILGTGIVRNQGRYVLRRVQEALARGQTPADPVMHGLLVFLGGFLLLTPGFVNDVVGFLFIIPGPRHLFVAYLKPRLAKNLKNGNFRVFSYQNVRTETASTRAKVDDGFERDVSPKVIDVTPISVETRERDEN